MKKVFNYLTEKLNDSQVIPSLFNNHQDSRQHHQFQTQQIKGLLSKSFQNNIKVKNMPLQVQKLVFVGKGFLKDNNFNSAIDCFAKAILIDPNCYISNYLLGLTLMTIGQFRKASQIFMQMIKKQQIKKNIYLLAAVCFKKIGNLLDMQYILNKCIQKYPNYYQAYIYRGKMKIKMKQIKDAQKDFETAATIDKTKLIALIGKADCLRLLQQHEQAIKIYTKVIEYNHSLPLMLKRSISFIQFGEYQKAQQDIQYILKIDQSNSQAYFFKGLIFHKKSIQILQENYNDAIICYQQAIKYNTNKKAVTKSIYQITKIKIEQRDYYQAFYTLCRVQYLDVEQRTLDKFRIFTDGVTFLMKRKQKQGLNLLCKLQKQYSIGNFIKPLLLSIRAYGYECIGKYEQALSDLNRLQKDFPLDITSLYNKFICEGIISCNKNKFQQAFSFFSKANKVIPTRMDPYFYKGMTLIQFSNKLIPSEDITKKLQYLNRALKNLQKGYQLNKSSANLIFYRGILKLYKGDKQKALKDIDMALTKCQQPFAKLFYVRGLINSSLKKFIDSINDFSQVIKLDFKKQYPQAYLNRAKCLIIYGDKSKAFADLQQYMLNNSSDPNIHMWAGNLLFYIGAFQDAINAYSHISNINKNKKILLLRAKAYILLKKYTQALTDLQKIFNLEVSSSLKFDYQMIDAIKISLYGQKIHFEQSLKKISKAKKKQQSAGEIFDYSDYFFFKSVFYFYLQNYDKSLKNLKKSKKIKQINIDAMKKAKLEGCQNISFYKMQFQNLTYNIYQYSFNIAICSIMNSDLQTAIKQLKNLLVFLQNQIGQQSFMENIQFFIQYLTQQIKSSNYKKCKLQSLENQQQEDQSADFMIFPTQNRLCSCFPQIRLRLKDSIISRYSFNFPKIEYPIMIPQLQPRFMQQLGVHSVQSKPQAPWIKRNNDGVVFTDEIQYIYDLDLQSSSKEEQYEQKQDLLISQQIYGSGKLRGGGEQVLYMVEKERIRDFLKLDDKIEQKLSKLCKK